jgi:hypothetical protein
MKPHFPPDLFHAQHCFETRQGSHSATNVAQSEGWACCVVPTCLHEPMQDSWRRVAESQYGVISRAQALEAGLSPSALHRQLRAQVFQTVHPGAYVVRGAPSSWRQTVMAAVISCPGSVAACRTAGALYGLAGCRAREVELLVTRRVSRRPAGVIIRSTKQLRDADITEMHGIPVTSPARALLDLGGVANLHTVRHAVEDAVRKGLVTPMQLHEQLRQAGRCGRSGTATLRAILAAYPDDCAGLESPLEEAMLRVIHDSGLPAPRTQFEVWDDGLLLARLDAAYPELLIGIEADGYEWHSARPDWVRDRRRQNELTSRDWTILRFCLEDATRPAPFVATLKRAYESKAKQMLL